ncbi:MAG: leucine-rich repeat protein [bacterium]
MSMNSYRRSKAFLLLLSFCILLQTFVSADLRAQAASSGKSVKAQGYFSSVEDLQEAETEASYQASGSSGAIRWSVDNHVLTISGSGKMPNYASEKAPWFKYRASVRTVIVKSGVTYIGNYAFKHIPMYAISIPQSVTSLGYKSFAYTDRLKSVYYGGDKKGWSKIKIGFGNSLLRTSSINFARDAQTAASLAKKTGDNSYTPRHSLRWVLSGTTLTISGNGTMMDYVSDPANTAPWHSRCAGSVTRIVISNGVTSVGNYAFYDFVKLKSIQLASSVKRIGLRAFYRCSGLNAVALPNSVTTIGKNAFQNCYNLSAVVLPRGLKTISPYTFNQCSQLRVVTIPASVTTIGQDAFWACSRLSKVNYKGSSSQWKKITIRSGNQPLKKADRVNNYAH